MTWISLICLLALTSSALGGYAYGGSDAVPQTPFLPAGWAQRMIPQTMLSQSYGQTVLPTVPSHPVVMHRQNFDTSSYQQQQQPIRQSFVAHMTAPKTLSVQSYAPVNQVGYGAVPVPPQLDQPVLTEADILCKGRQAEDVIPIDNNHKFIICLDNGKGVEQQCPAGLFYHATSKRCERTAGALEDACISQPCLNGGQCFSSGTSSYQCQCAPGYEGVVCELDARVCQSQQPCGTSPDVKCQSFRAGAALQYVCIFQKGLGYGLNPQQIIPSPCQGTEGAQALAVSQNGFLMCDGTLMFVESCPGGTIWDDVEKACSWPDQQAAPQDTPIPTSAYGYGNQIIPQQQTQVVIPKQLARVTQSYGAQVAVPQQQQQRFLQPSQSYGAQITVPQQHQQQQFLQPTQSYGAQITVPQQQHQQQQFLQPTQSYGAQITVPQQQHQQQQFLQPTQSYGAQVTLPQQQQQRFLQPTQSYGAQITVPQQQPAIIAPKQLVQPSQSYGAQVTVPQQQSAIIAPKQFVQPSQSYGAQVTVPQQQQQQQPAAVAPFGSAQFSSY